jgi:heterodisulfide reductase subunit B
MKYLYYPGCSLRGTGRAYEESLLAVCGALGVELQEIEEWNCCGATAYMGIDELKALTLASRNLALAAREGRDVVAPCSACYLVLNKTQHYVQEHPAIRRHVTQALDTVGLHYEGNTVAVRHPLDVFVNDVGLEAIAARIAKPLRGLRIAPYYGCQLVRPYATFDDQVEPVSMDKLLKLTGAEVVDYPLKTRCCGGSMTGTVPEVGLRLAYILLREALRRGADLIATTCPLCQFNLDAYQHQIRAKYGACSIPVLYFTQVLGLALGLPARQLGLQRGIVPVAPVLEKRELSYA